MADRNHDNVLKIKIALENEPANVKRNLMATADRNLNNIQKI